MSRSERENLARKAGDKWRPPALEPGRSALGRGLARLRRFFDLQAGSLWVDVSAEAGSWQGKVVDVGCGAQPYRALLPPGTVYVGLDIDDAEASFGYAVPDVLQFDGGRWPELTRNADVVLCTEVLEHVPDPSALLAEAYSALRPGGRLLLTVPFAARWHFVPHDYWRFTPSSLSLLLERAGFRNVVVRARGDELTVACYKLMALWLPFLMPQVATPRQAWAMRLCVSPTVPAFVAIAAVANLSLYRRGGDDCLGYTVTAERPPE